MVDNLVSAVALALDLVPVVSAKRDIALPNGIPLENLKLGIVLDALLGFAVDFVDKPPFSSAFLPTIKTLESPPTVNSGN